MRRLALAVLAAALLASPAAAKPAMWVVHGKRATVVLFGSIHILPHGLDWRPPDLDAALGKADELWFELPITGASDEQASELSLERGLLVAGDSLWAHLSPQEGDRVSRVALGLGVAPAALDGMKPWLAEVTLSLAVDAKAGALVTSGVEQSIQGRTPLRVRRRAFETPAQQIGFLAGADLADQVASLDETVREIEDEPGAYDRIVAEWLAGDLACLETDSIAPLARVSPAMFERLITSRNRRWAQILAHRLKGRGVAVVVVGAGHLLGPGGLPALLRARGLRVDGPVADGPCEVRPPPLVVAVPAPASAEAH